MKHELDAFRADRAAGRTDAQAAVEGAADGLLRAHALAQDLVARALAKPAPRCPTCGQDVSRLTWPASLVVAAELAREARSRTDGLRCPRCGDEVHPISPDDEDTADAPDVRCLRAGCRWSGRCAECERVEPPLVRLGPGGDFVRDVRLSPPGMTP